MTALPSLSEMAFAGQCTWHAPQHMHFFLSTLICILFACSRFHYIESDQKVQYLCRKKWNWQFLAEEMC